MRRVSLDELLLTPAAVEAWLTTAKLAAQAVAALGIDPRSIPDEQAGILRNGDLKIYVTVAVNGSKNLEFSVTVPRSEWSWRTPQN